MPRPSRLTGSPQSSASGLRQWLDEAARLALDRPHRLSDPFGLPGDPALANYLGKVALVDRDVRRPVLLDLMIVEVFVERDVAAAIAGVEGRQHEQGQQGS
ncbi:hypothetical protein KXV85_005789 [Aspergillus fumigatus]|nr:hypothetical protein KXV85_005789 [Aspergillus fumigatus]